ncbi:MAG: aromatic amino acid lyase [Alphaproteobacteria bacterium]|nr:aromatic amino acid lyase [Alphaproteobacteria bacterium]
MSAVYIDGASLSARKVAAVAGGAPVRLASSAREAMRANHDAWRRHGTADILGDKETWLIGASTAASPRERVRGFVLSHCAGVGPPLAEPEVRALMLCRANVLAAACSGVRPELVELLLAMLNKGVHPVVPAKGSVGAAGDLAPLAHVAQVALRMGGRATVRGEALDGVVAMQGLPEVKAASKETLSLINGASLTVACGALAVHRAERLLRSAERALAQTMAVVLADADCLDARAMASRRHPGACAVAERMRALIEGSALVHRGRSADAFSIRCAPAVLGAAWDALDYVRGVVEHELNGACDNPLLFDGEVIEAGNFHGAPVALALDHLKVALTQVASIAERRVFRMTYGRLTGNLPSFLLESSGVDSGFMLAQYTAASLVSECKGLAHPASVDSIPTGQHHEDHVPMGPAAARGLLAIVENLAEVLAIELLVGAQGLDFRLEGTSFSPKGEKITGQPVAPASAIQEIQETVRAVSPRWTADRVLHRDLEAVARRVRAGDFEGPRTEPAAPW